MYNKKLIRFVESFVILPIMTVSMPFGNVPNNSVNPVVAPQTVLSQQLNIEANGLFAFNQAMDQKAETLQSEADAIDAYYKAHNMPLEGTGMLMAKAAYENGLDYRLLPAITAIESTGGREACHSVSFNAFGWGSCRIGFKSNEDAINTIARHLGGNEEKTAKYYENKTVDQILKTYNPPSVVPDYSKKVMRQMKEIGKDPAIAASV